MILILLILITIAVVFSPQAARGLILLVLGVIFALYLLGTIIIATGG